MSGLARQAREATKHVDSTALALGSEFNSRRLHQILDFELRISNCEFEIRTPNTRGLNSIRNSQSEIRNSNLPIGIFDSGVGGLTVYRALHEHLPNERFVYLGDTARVPYGTKSLATVERYAIENSKFLEAHGIKLLVVACNTASALALPAIREAVSVEVVGVIEPGARAAVAAAAGKSIAIIATEATVQSRAYSRAIRALEPHASVIERACPLFVPLAEEGWVDTEVTRNVAAQYLGELTNDSLGALVMGCTHYPILRTVIGATVGSGVPLIDSGEATAREVEVL